MKEYFTWKVWILLLAILLGAFALAPNPWASGVEITSIDASSDAVQFGLAAGQKILSINGQEISNEHDVLQALSLLYYPEQELKVKTSEEEVTYIITNDLGFLLDANLSLVDSSVNVSKGSTLLSINGEAISDSKAFEDFYDTIIPKKVINIKTDQGLVAYLSREIPPIVVSEAKKTNLAFGLDFTGGTRVLLQPVSDEEISDEDISTLIDVLSNRLNVYGLSDIKIRSASDWEGNKYVLVELAGVTEQEVKSLISQQGKFEAKVGEEVVFEGGKKDIPYVCRNDGTCSGIRNCKQSTEFWTCSFDFSITLSQDAAEQQADATRDLDVVSESGQRYLSEPLDLYLDGELVDSLLIGENLKGQATTGISISGPGYGSTESAAVEDATASMNTLQTILITGSLPFDLEIVKLDTISPIMGESFLRNMLFVGLLSILAVGIVILVRYKKFSFFFPVMFTLFVELFLILGFAAFVKWNLDIAALAGILAAIGTGVDDQIVILDEAVRGRKENTSTKERLKRAFFIIFAAYATTVVAMLPLWNAGAGLLRGFALTTIAGVTIGVFLTRPAFASFVEKIDTEKKE
ncbi:MAG: hypothetical protein Q8R18_00835 [bacterium]|nr:hypothetical protein [bacterium]